MLRILNKKFKRNLVLTLIISILSISFRYANTYLTSKINTENLITEQLNSDLNRFLPSGSFMVFTNVKLELLKEKKIIESEVSKYSPLGRPRATDLPGFRDLPGLWNLQGNKNERELYNIEIKEKLTSILVKIVFSQDLPEKSINQAKTIVRDKLNYSFGDIVKLNFVISDLPKIAASGAERIWGKFGSLLEKFLSSPLLWLLLLAILILLALRYFKRSKKALQPTPKKDDKSTPEAKKAQPGLLLDEPERRPAKRQTMQEVVDEFIDEISHEPIVARKFLKQLDTSDQKMINSALKTHSLKKLLSPSLDLSDSDLSIDSETGLKSSKEKADQLKDIINDLKNYKKVCEFNLKQPMGIISFFSPAELDKLLMDKHYAEVFLTLPYLNKSQIQYLMQNRSLEEKRKIISLIKSGKVVQPDKQKQILDKIAVEAKKIADEYRPDFSTSEGIIEIIIDDLQDNEDELRETLKEHADLYEKFSYYFLKLEDVLTLEKELIQRKIENLSNDFIAMVLLGAEEETRSKFMEIIPETRSDIIESLLISLKDTDPARIRQMTKDFLKGFQEDLKTVRSAK